MNQYADNINQLTTIRRQVYIFAAVLVLVLLLSMAIRKWQQQQAYDQIGNDADAQLAYKIRQACNPAGSFLGANLIDIDGTDEEALFAAAAQVQNLNKVRTAYRKLYNEELLDRLAAELEQQDVTRWLALAGGTGAPPPTPIVGKSLVYARTTAIMYDASDSRKVVKTLIQGEQAGTYQGERNIKHTNGQTYRYVEVSYTAYLFLTFRAFVRKDFVKIA